MFTDWYLRNVDFPHRPFDRVKRKGQSWRTPVYGNHPKLYDWRMKSALAVLMVLSYLGAAQESDTGPLDRVTHSATFIFFLKDRTCITGRITSADASIIAVQSSNGASIKLERNQLLQVVQGDAPLFSGRSSWDDVAQAHPYPREALVLTLKHGKRISGKPVNVAPENITLKHGLAKTVYQKSEISIVEYLRRRPPSDNFQFFLEEAPYLLFFYPEFYYRAAGLEGRIRVRLYDASLPEDDAPLKCRAPGH